MKLLFARQPLGWFRFSILCLFSVACMVADHHFARLAEFRSGLVTALYPLQYLSYWPLHAFATAKGYLQSHQALAKEYQILQQQQFLQDGRLQRLVAIEAENERLRYLLKSSQSFDFQYQVAEVIQQDPASDKHYLILNQGLNAGIHIGQPVVDADGVVGEVTEVYPFSCKIILITDVSHAIPVENVRNQVRGILHGLGRLREMKLQHTFGQAELEVGDILVTSGLGGNYPYGYPVGEVQAVDQNPGDPFQCFKVKPKAKLDRIRQVLLVSQLPLKSLN